MRDVLIGEDSLAFTNKHMLVRFADTRQVMSTSVLNGGYREDLMGVFNYDEKPEDGSRCEMRASTYLEHMALVAAELGLDAGRFCGLSTAAGMEYTATAAMTYGGIVVTAVVTAGLNGNAGRAGDPAAWNEGETTGERRDYQPGTINIFLFIDAGLLPGTMTRAIVTGTEAKTAAIQEFLVPSRYSSGLATGSGTDGFVVVANPRSPVTLTDAGKHSKLGELIGRTVTAAVKEALTRHTGLCMRSQHCVEVRMGRYGVTEERLYAAVHAKMPERNMSPPDFFRVLAQREERTPLVAYTSCYVHLLDQLQWGLLTGGEAAAAAGGLLETLSGGFGAPKSGTADLNTLIQWYVDAVAGLLSE